MEYKTAYEDFQDCFKKLELLRFYHLFILALLEAQGLTLK